MLLDSAVGDQDRQALEALVVDNPDLARLEALLDRFNILEALGVVRRELSHSHFLAYLLDPQQPHGLGDTFATRLLQSVLSEHRGEKLPVTPLDLDLWDLGEITVQREWRNIDILLVDEVHHLIVLIENKIDTTEHSDQLRRYYASVQERYSGWRVLALYLTPTGEAPSHAAYLSVGYGTVCVLIETLAEQYASTLGTDVRTLLLHYAQMLRRHVVSESEIAELCRRIYAKHRRALELIYEHRVGPQAAVMEVVRGLVQQLPEVVLDEPKKTSPALLRFTLQGWDIPMLRAGEGWTASRRMLLFEIDNWSERCILSLYVGPGPQETRQRLLAIARHGGPLFKITRASATRWNRIYNYTLAPTSAYKTADPAELEQEVRTHWEEFRQQHLPTLAAVINAELADWPT